MEKDRVTDFKKLIVIGGSAGSLQPLFRILEQLPATFNSPILLVLHRDTTEESNLAELMSGKTHLRTVTVEEKEQIQNDTLYITPADYHVLIEKDATFSLDFSEKVNYSRPSIDVVFSSAADSLGEKVVAVLLSGASSDGTEGLLMVREMGGIVVIQDPADAQTSFMPEYALRKLAPEKLLPSIEIGKYLASL